MDTCYFGLPSTVTILLVRDSFLLVGIPFHVVFVRSTHLSTVSVCS